MKNILKKYSMLYKILCFIGLFSISVSMTAFAYSENSAKTAPNSKDSFDCGKVIQKIIGEQIQAKMELKTTSSHSDAFENKVTVGKVVYENEKIEYKTEYVNDNAMYKDQSKTVQEGVCGEEEVKYFITYTYSGEIVDKVPMDSVVTKQPTTKVVKVGTKERPKKVSTPNTSTDVSAPSSSGNYSPSYFKVMGVLSWGGWRWTWYSEKVLPGGGLNIPGRHVDGNRFVCDGNGYICLASDKLSYGTVVNTPFGKQGKVYDCGVGRKDTLDVYVSW